MAPSRFARPLRVALLFSLLPVALPAQTPAAAPRWARTTAETLAKGAAGQHGSIPVVFVGSSSISMWSNLAQTFPHQPLINRGVGGLYLADVADLLPGLALAFQPQTLVVYAGENDIGSGLSVDAVVDAFARIHRQLRAAQPDARLIFLALKPSLLREPLLLQFQEANRRIQATCEQDPRCTFVDVFTPMLGADGRPRPELFIEDGLHLNHHGYKLWNELLAPHLRPAAP